LHPTIVRAWVVRSSGSAASPPDGRSHRLDFDPPEERRSLLPLLAMTALSWLLILAMGLVITGTMR